MSESDRTNVTTLIIVAIIAVIGLVIQSNLLLQESKYLKLSPATLLLPLTLMYVLSTIFAFLWIKLIVERRYTAFVKMLAIQVAAFVFLVWAFSVVYV